MGVYISRWYMCLRVSCSHLRSGCHNQFGWLSFFRVHWVVCQISISSLQWQRGWHCREFQKWSVLWVLSRCQKWDERRGLRRWCTRTRGCKQDKWGAFDCKVHCETHSRLLHIVIITVENIERVLLLQFFLPKGLLNLWSTVLSHTLICHFSCTLCSCPFHVRFSIPHIFLLLF